MLKKLRIKIVCFTMAIVTVMLCVIFGLVYYFTAENLETESISMMQTIANEPFRLGRPGERPDEIQLPYFTLQVGQRGEVLAMGGGYYDLSDEEFIGELLTVVLSGQEETGVLKEYNLRYCRVTTPMSWNIVFADMSSEQATLNSLIQSCVFIGVLSFLVFFGISLYLARIAVKPVEKAWDQQKQFVADASHELKTPLTVIMTNAELLQSAGQDEAAKAQSSNSILAMSRQMRGLVEGLLDLARVDNGAGKMTFAEVDLSQLVSDGLLPFEPVYFEQGLELVSEIEAGIKVKGSESHLRQVVDILLDNAMKYSSPEGQVTVMLKRQGSSSLLAVSNPGDVISKEDLKNIFKRFYRVDQARSMNQSYGLGLSIAERIVQEHKGKIWAESAQGQNTFFVQLPANP